MAPAQEPIDGKCKGQEDSEGQGIEKHLISISSMIRVWNLYGGTRFEWDLPHAIGLL